MFPQRGLLFCLALLVALPSANGGFVTPNDPSAGLTRYQENFDALPTGSAPADTWYTLGLLGTGVSQVQTAPAGLSVKAWQVTDGGVPFIARLRNNAANVNLCTTGQSNTVDVEVPDLTTTDVREIRWSVGATAISNAAAPIDTFGLRITGIIGGTNSANFFARGNTGAVQLSATGVQTPATPVHIQVSQVNCAGTGCAVFTFTGLTSLTSPLTQCAAGGDPFVGILNAFAVVDTSSMAAATVWVDNYDWQGAASPAAAAPTITSFSPSSGYPGQSFTITGTGFSGPTVLIGSVSAPVTASTSTSITATIPGQFPGTYTVAVTNSDAQSGTKTGFTVQAVPAGPGACLPETALRIEQFNGNVGDVPAECWYTFSQRNTEGAFLSDNYFGAANFQQGQEVLSGAPQEDDQLSVHITDTGADGYVNFKMKNGFDFCGKDIEYSAAIGFQAPSTGGSHSVTRIGIVEDAALPNNNPFTAATGYRVYLDITPGVAGTPGDVRLTARSGALGVNSVIIPNVGIVEGQFYYYGIASPCFDTHTFGANGEHIPLMNGLAFVYDSQGHILGSQAYSVASATIPSAPVQNWVIKAETDSYLDILLTVAQLVAEESRTITNIAGFESSESGAFLVVRQSGTSQLIHSLGPDLQDKAATFDSDCNVVHGVMAADSNINGNGAIGFVNNCETVKDLSFRDSYLNNPPGFDSDIDFNFFDITNSPQEIARVDAFPIDYSYKWGQEGVFGDGCTDIEIAFSEMTTGNIGLYVQEFCDVGSGSDSGYVLTQNFGNAGSTVTQLCTYNFDPDGPGDQPKGYYIAAAMAGKGVGVWQLTDPLPGDAPVHQSLTRLNINNGLLINAVAIDCSGGKLLVATVEDQVYVLQSTTNNGVSIGTILQTYAAPGVVRGAGLSEDGRFGAVITDGGNIFIMETNHAGFVGSGTDTMVMPSTFTVHVDALGNYLYIADQSWLRKYPLYYFTHFGSVSTGTQLDTDADGIPNDADPNPVESDCDGDNIIDGQDPVVQCDGFTYNGVDQAQCTTNPELQTCQNPFTALPPGQSGGRVRDGNIFVRTGSTIPEGFTEATFKFLIGVLLMFAFTAAAFFAFGKTALAAIIGATVGFFASFAFGLFPIWIIVVLVVAAIALLFLRLKSGATA